MSRDAPPDFYARPAITKGELRRVIWLIPNGTKAATWICARAQGVIGITRGIAVSCATLHGLDPVGAFSHAERAARDIVSAGMHLEWDKLPLETKANSPGFCYRNVGEAGQSFYLGPPHKGRK